MTLLMQSLHRFELSLDDYLLNIMKKNTVLSYVLVFVGVPVAILSILFVVALIFLPLAYVLV